MEKKMRATGPFDVKVIPQPPSDPSDAGIVGRMLLDKKFHGDLEELGSSLDCRGR